MSNTKKALLLGDIVGQPGCRALFFNLKGLIKDLKADAVIVNAENSADGFGLTTEIADNLFSLGVDVITSGNHIWQKDDIFSYLKSKDNLLRPSNYPGPSPGKGYCLIEKQGMKFAVINLQGREKMFNIDCPFKEAKKLLRQINNETSNIFIDFHAELVEEKEALAFHVDGEVTALVGTHTHVQTADERVSSKGTAYITDLGMCGVKQSVIGFEPHTAIERSISQMPLKMEVSEGDVMINGLLVTFNADTGKALDVERIRMDA